MEFGCDAGNSLKKNLLSRAGYLTFGFVVLLNIAFTWLTDVTFDLKTALNISSAVLLYLASVYATFCSMGETARRDARAKEEYRTALAECRKRSEKAMPHRRYLCRYTASYLREDLLARRRACLEAVGIDPDLCQTLCAMSRRAVRRAEMSGEEKKAVLRAKKMRPRRIPDNLLCGDEETTPGHPIPVRPGKMLARRYTASLLPTTLFASFTAEIVFAVRVGQNPRILLVQSLLRVGLLGWTAIRGYSVGEKTVTVDTVNYLRAKTDFLDEFLEWVKKHFSTAENREISPCIFPSDVVS